MFYADVRYENIHVPVDYEWGVHDVLDDAVNKVGNNVRWFDRGDGTCRIESPYDAMDVAWALSEVENNGDSIAYVDAVVQG